MLLLLLYVLPVQSYHIGIYRGSLYGVNAQVTVTTEKDAHFEIDGGLLGGRLEGTAHLENPAVSEERVKFDKTFQKALQERCIRIINVDTVTPNSIRVVMNLPVVGSQEMQLTRDVKM